MTTPTTTRNSNATAVGAFDYATLAAAGTITVPAGASIFNVAALAGAAAATISIDGGATIPVPAGTPWGANLGGRKTGSVAVNIVFGGTVDGAYVDWVAE